MNNSTNLANSSPNIVFVMGVSGSGKSTVAEALAESLGAHFIDADDFHSDQAKQLMAKGISLTDEQRAPWIARLCEEVKSLYDKNQSLVLACSLLRKAHRFTFYQQGIPLTLVYLKGDKALIAERLAARQGHFFPASLLDKQFEDLQPPEPPEPVFELSVDASLNQQVLLAQQHIKNIQT